MLYSDFNEPILVLPVTNSNNASEMNTARSTVPAPLTIDPEAIAMLSSMGYSEDQTRAALIATDYNIER